MVDFSDIMLLSPLDPCQTIGGQWPRPWPRGSWVRPPLLKRPTCPPTRACGLLHLHLQLWPAGRLSSTAVESKRKKNLSLKDLKANWLIHNVCKKSVQSSSPVCLATGLYS